jgi:hypothetical protein
VRQYGVAAVRDDQRQCRDCRLPSRCIVLDFGWLGDVLASVTQGAQLVPLGNGIGSKNIRDKRCSLMALYRVLGRGGLA